MRVLIIDDDAEIREMIYMMLSEEGYEVLLAADGEEGIRTIRIQPEFNLVITDIIMPEKEGIETIREIRRDFPNIRILAISGGGEIAARDYLSMAEQLGADSSLAKPFVKQDLLEAIQKILEGK